MMVNLKNGVTGGQRIGVVHARYCLQLPVHNAPADLKFGRFVGEDEPTTPDSDRLVRLPLYYNIEKADIHKVIDKTIEFFGG